MSKTNGLLDFETVRHIFDPPVARLSESELARLREWMDLSERRPLAIIEPSNERPAEVS